jgi:transketolase
MTSVMTDAALQQKLDPRALRKNVLRMAHAGKSVHIACAFSLIEIISVLYSKFIHHSAAELTQVERNHLILSKGHGVMAMYSAFERLGWLDPIHLQNYFKDGTLLHGLCEAKVPGFEVSSGSLGHGLPIATGMVLGFRQRRLSHSVYCIVGDGELNEGSMWEALLFAGHHHLDKLTVIVDANGYQAMGPCESIMNLEPLKEKFASFGFHALECDGHSPEQLEAALSASPNGKPKAIIARTIKGKGVSFMENENNWHYLRLSDEQLNQALAELNS